MRLFVAVELDPSVLAQISECSRELRRRTEQLAPASRVTWVPPDRLHVTVRFIGSSDATQTAAIDAALEPPLGTRRFDVAVGGVGAFPERGRPRVFWAGLAAGGEALGRLEQEVSGRLELCGVPREEQPYRPHVTLARIRDARGLRSEALLAGLADRLFGRSPVDTITLFESRPSSAGHVYVPLRRSRLGPA